MIKSKIENYLKKAVKKETDFELFIPENEKFGHYSTNVALKLAKTLNKEPMKIAEEIDAQLKKQSKFFGLINETKIAPPGFINFWIAPGALQNEIKEILKKREKYGPGQPRRKSQSVQIEFISANPTGPLTIGNGRGAFLGDVLVNVLKFSGFKVSREYYINDAKVNTQIKELGKTGLELSILYLTDALKNIITNLKSRIHKLKLKHQKNLEGEVGYLIAKEIQKGNRNFIKKSLKIKFDNWFSEENLYKSGAIDKLLKELEGKNLTHNKDGAIWLKTKNFGDREDRVLVRQPRLAGQAGEPTYFLPDLAYHCNKFKTRKFNKVIDIWGADHHGYEPRLRAGLRIFKIADEKFKVIITQLVRLVKSGREMRMSKRKGEYITLEDLIKEVGLDAARFFFLMYSPDTHMDFNLDLAKERSLKNPVYYVQYAAVRCQSISKKAKINIKISDVPRLKFNLLNTPEDSNLMRLLGRFPEVVEETARNYNPQILVRYSLDLARQFHNFYEKERIIGAEKDLMLARLGLNQAILIIFKNIFSLLNISLPRRM